MQRLGTIGSYARTILSVHVNVGVSRTRSPRASERPAFPARGIRKRHGTEVSEGACVRKARFTIVQGAERETLWRCSRPTARGKIELTKRNRIETLSRYIFDLLQANVGHQRAKMCRVKHRRPQCDTSYSVSQRTNDDVKATASSANALSQFPLQIQDLTTQASPRTR